MTSPPPRLKPWGLWATAGLSVCVLALFFLAQTAVAVTALLVDRLRYPDMAVEALAENLSSNGLVLAIATLVSAPLCIGLIFFFIKLRRRGTIADYLQLHRPRYGILGIWCLLTICFILMVDRLKSLFDRPEIPTFTTDVYETAYILPLLYLAIVVAAPLFEEIFFRGFMFQGIRRSPLGAVGAVLITASFWAIIHSQYDMYDMAGIFLFGLLLGTAQVVTKSLYVAIAMHAFNNLLALMVVAFDIG